MRDLLVNSWEDFQDIGCYWMRDFVLQNHDIDMPYCVYGSMGQAQGGVDLVPASNNFGIVGQSKCWNVRSLTRAEIEKELAKSNDYPGPIQHYVILTTAAKHTSVQDIMKSGGFTYRRSQGSFQVHIRYWSDLENLDFIPEQTLLRIFPSLVAQAKTIAARQSMPNDCADSLLHARRVMPQLISQAHLSWLDSWDFKLGYVPLEVFELFHCLSIEMDRVLAVAANPCLHEWLREGNRAQLFKCLPAANDLFLRVIEFARAVVDESVSEILSGRLVLAHGHSDDRAKQRVASKWECSAQQLLLAYREVVDGSPQS
ncbi:hypothetical protein [Rubrivivax gelatinosus]|uniref:Restriction endonuclease n=1 Tax=Rubrivivax gelatinosus (strain NBRC 100245 / IL144) TaxID=983917 RepID=I0HQE8_RUBGI|nr:hypothetical protein [Rubrivivax gelatinosus]BAL95235.1 hypothetical protein RGE_18940 [Rubrivivax gelatinosus IL144]